MSCMWPCRGCAWSVYVCGVCLCVVWREEARRNKRRGCYVGKQRDISTAANEAGPCHVLCNTTKYFHVCFKINHLTSICIWKRCIQSTQITEKWGTDRKWEYTWHDRLHGGPPGIWCYALTPLEDSQKSTLSWVYGQTGEGGRGDMRKKKKGNRGGREQGVIWEKRWTIEAGRREDIQVNKIGEGGRLGKVRENRRRWREGGY